MAIMLPRENRFYYVLDNLGIEYSLDKTFTAQLIYSINILTEPKKALTVQFLTETTRIASLIQQGIQAFVKTTQEKVQVRTKKDEASLDPSELCWYHGHKVIHRQNSKTCTNWKEGHQGASVKTNTIIYVTSNMG